jgi:hypothetical protein
MLTLQFNPLIIAGYGFSKSRTTLMATPQAAVAFVAQVVCTALAYFVPNIRCVLWTLSSLPALAGAIMIHSKKTFSNKRFGLTVSSAQHRIREKCFACWGVSHGLL